MANVVPMSWHVEPPRSPVINHCVFSFAMLSVSEFRIRCHTLSCTYRRKFFHLPLVVKLEISKSLNQTIICFML